ncbi:putative UBA-like superfamily, Ubiquitin-associated domain-containing protein [Helianthus annuus]|nr:putative UBA-like superfamily, Ubiquitin-associated domain-containing protein [Helianthus annuus]KAJ0633354.1 putative UBA-like superfamily, Ubiquitin-associated domain-containing protein [Helianthus annuus]KAJ0827465.1 putative UBA-like superfamily, Ubiquitin-associated domain-containing protein [Helianthus annuus]
MSSRSKSKDKKAAGKEPLKPSTKPTTSAIVGGSAPASGYNPLLGTFHSLETAPVSSVPPVHANGRFRDIDDTDDPSGNSVVEYDCVSNNGSWSGESEDPKDKPSQGPTSRQEASHGVDSDKREKIRQKNEKKHQRQKERRAQELHERCCGYLMSRKLEALAQQLVAMGFSSERATMALILNEGRLEESVAWLFDVGEDSVNQKEPKSDHGGGGGNLKVDISQELAQIADMEIKFKCSKQEVERAVVACEGDLDQAAEHLLKFQKQESNAPPPKPEDIQTGVPPKPPVGVTQMPPASQAAPPLSKTEAQYTGGVGNEFKNLQIGSVREPVIMMQRAQPKQIPAASMSSSSSSHSVVEPVMGMSPNGGFHATRSFNGNTPSYRTNQLYDQFHYQPRHVSNSGLMDHHGGQPPVATNHLNNNGLWNNRTVGSTSTPPLAAATSLGLFSGFGSNGISNPSQVDWNGDWSSQFDYTNIDWSLNRLPSPAGSAFIPNGLWMGAGSSPGRSAVKPASSIGGLHRPDGVGVVGGGSEAASGGSREWTSPFEEKDLFSLPRQFVSSPSL